MEVQAVLLQALISAACCGLDGATVGSAHSNVVAPPRPYPAAAAAGTTTSSAPRGASWCGWLQAKRASFGGLCFYS